MSPDTHDITERFQFTSECLPKDGFHVVRFAGTEGLNSLYRFEITLASQSTHLSIERLLSSPAKLTLLREDGRHAHFHGYITQFTQSTHYNGWTFYTAVLQPRFWKLTQLVQNRIYLNKNVKDLVEEALFNATIQGMNTSFKLQGSYEPQAFSMQYNESLYDYIAWKLERDGLYYFFDQESDGESIVFTDNKYAHTSLKDTPTLTYSPTSGLENAHREEVISSFVLHQTQLPKNVFVRDYDWMRPSTPVTGKAVVSPRGLGDVYFYGDGFTTEAEGNRLAAIRAEGLLARGRSFSGISAVPTLRPGYLFTLERHFDPTLNREYMITRITHEGSQEAYLSSVIGVTLEHPTDTLYYRNQFNCLESDVQFRPEHVTERHRISGVLNAFIDSSTKTGKAEINKHGCYKVIFPQDLSGRADGKASCWIRRSHPHVGAGHGSSFPLTPGIEVLIQFLDGDPDRPIIVGALSNPESGFMESDESSYISGISTEGGGGMLFSNKDTKQAVSLTPGSTRSGIRMAAGSMDVFESTSDFVSSSASTFTTEVGGILKLATSSLENSIEVGAAGAEKYIMAAATAADKVVGSVAKSMSTVTKVHGGLVSANALLKTAPILYKICKTVQKLAKNKLQAEHPYSMSLTSSGKESSLTQQTKADSLSTTGIMSAFALNLAAVVASTAADVIAGEEKAAKTETDVRDKKKKADISKKLIEALNAKGTLTPKEKEKKEEAEKALKENTALSSKLEAQLNMVYKQNAVMTAVSTKIPVLLAEFAAMLASYKKISDLKGKSFGGVLIQAPESNVSIGAKTETRIVADHQIALHTAAGSRAHLEVTNPDTLKACYDALFKLGASDERIIMSATALRSLSLKDSHDYALTDKAVRALGKITLSTDAAEFASITNNLSAADPQGLLNVSRNTKLEAKRTSREQEGHSTLEMDKHEFMLLNKGTRLEIKQDTTKSNAKLTIERESAASGIKNTLSFTKDDVVLSYKKSADFAALTLSKNTASLDVQEKTSVVLKPDKISVRSNNNIVFSSTSDKTDIMGGTITCEGKQKITLEASTVNVIDSKFTKASIELKAQSITVNGQMIKLA